MRVLLLALAAVTAPLWAAEGTEPTFLRRQVASVRAQDGYRAVFGAGDPDSKMLKGIARFGELVVDAGASSATNLYAAEENVWVVLEGSGTLRYGDQDVAVSRHDFLYLPPGVRHSLACQSGPACRVVVMGFRIPAGRSVSLPPKALVANMDEVPKQVVGNHPPSTLYQLLMGDTRSKRDRLAAAHVLTSLFVMEIAPGGTNQPHHHEREEEIYLLLEGAGDMVAGGGLEGVEGRYASRPGDAFFFRLNCTVGFYNTGPATARILAVRSLFPFDRPASAATASEDRAVARWVIRQGGSVIPEGQRRPIWRLEELPEADFRLHTVDLTGAIMDPSDLDPWLGKFSGLKALYLNGRTWHSRPPAISAASLAVVATIPGLEKFGVSLPVQTDIPIEDGGIANLAPLKGLRELRLRQTKIRGRTLGTFTQLRLLDASYTPLDDAGMRSLAGMTQLERLHLRDTLVTDEGLRSLVDLRQLEELDLSGARITDAGLAHLKDLTRLKRLNLLGAAVTDEGLAHLAGMTGLEELNLYRSQVTNAGLERLAALGSLHHLDVRYTRSTGAGVAALRARRPECKVAFLELGTSRPATPRLPAPRDDKAIAEWVQSLGGKALLKGGRLREVSLASTPITDAQMELLAGLAGIEKLDLAFTEVGDVGARSLGGLAALTELDLSHTTLTDRGLEHVAGLRSLRRLSLNETLVGGQGLGHLAGLAALQELNLAGLAVGDDGLRRLAAFSSLERLSLAHSDSTDSGLAHLATLTRLRRLDLTGADIGDRGLAHLGRLASLEDLSLGHGRFTDKGIESLQPLTKLAVLELVRTRVSDRGLESIGKLQNLVRLNLDYTAVSDAGLAHLARLERLTELKLNSATVTDAGLAQLKALAGLQVLNLYHTLVTEKGYQELRAALPNCRIIWDRNSSLPNRRGS